MIGYATLGTNDIAKARSFYDALLGSIGAKRMMEFGDELGGFTMYGAAWDKPALAVTMPHDKQPATPGNGNMIALVVDERAKVDALHKLALELGGTCEGPPGLRGDEGPQAFYGAYFRDPDGNKLCAFRTGPAA
jgi:catechol 2,3-dioxygenase-like lactoylglutathione lyase family enzyme